MMKKGQLGKIITTIPVLILLIVIMAFFVFISSSLSAFKGEGKVGEENVAGLNSVNSAILFEEFKIREERLPFGLAYVKYRNDSDFDSGNPSPIKQGNIKREEIISFLKSKVDDNNDCLIVEFQGVSKSDGFLDCYFIKWVNEKVEYSDLPGSCKFEDYISAGLAENVSFNANIKGKTVRVNYQGYYGPCMGEKNE